MVTNLLAWCNPAPAVVMIQSRISHNHGTTHGPVWQYAPLMDVVGR